MGVQLVASTGIPYFPLECQLDEKIQLIEAEFGLTGFAIVVKLFQRIYGGHGYYCEWTKDVVLLFSAQAVGGGNIVSEIVESALKRGIFSQKLYDKYHILTSKGIQKRYFEAVSRRKKVEVKKEYLLLDYAVLPNNVDISSKNVDISEENVDISEQSKEEKRKEKKSKEEERIEPSDRLEEIRTKHPSERLEEIRKMIRETNSEYEGGIDV
ncbi:hypothetical protein M2140_001950 [Clostridiales Family XIII bacterium PM5-7]